MAVPQNLQKMEPFLKYIRPMWLKMPIMSLLYISSQINARIVISQHVLHTDCIPI